MDADNLTRFHDDDQQRERDEESYLWLLDNIRPHVVVDQHDGQFRVRIMRGTRQFGEATRHPTQAEAFSHALDIGLMQGIKAKEG